MTADYFSLAGGKFEQNWTNTGLITTDDNWSAVPSIIGYRGDDITTVTATDPQTLLGNDTPGVVDVIANQTNPNTQATGGVAEFAITDPTIALQGSGTADAPYIVIHLDSTGRQNIQFSFNARDIDGSADNSVQQIAVQYRTSPTGSWTNLPAGYIADASTGPNLATLVTPVSVTLPAGAGEGSALIEGFRGECLAWVRLDEGGLIRAVFLRDPSWLQWPLVEAAIEGNIVADFPLCNKSFNCSYSGVDL